MFCVVFYNGHRVPFRFANSLLCCIVINCPKLSLFDVKQLTDWVHRDGDYSPFVVDKYKFYVVKEK